MTQLSLLPHNGDPRPDEAVWRRFERPGVRVELRWDWYGWAVIVVCLSCEATKLSTPPPTCFGISPEIFCCSVGTHHSIDGDSPFTAQKLTQRLTACTQRVKQHMRWHAIMERTTTDHEVPKAKERT